MSEYDYDLIVIGSGPGGQRAAIQAAKLKKKVALVDKNPRIGGVCLHDGTIPSKSFREAIMHLSGYKMRSQFGESFRVKHNIEMEDLTRWSGSIVTNIEQTLRTHLLRNKVEVICGLASFDDCHHIRITSGNKQEVVTAEFIVVATGTAPRRPKGFEFDDEVILDSNGILHMKTLPRNLAIVGGGVIGCEYASLFSTLGVEVTLIEARSSILGIVDEEIREALSHYLRQERATILLNEKVVKCKKAEDGRAVTYLDSGKSVVADALLVSAGRVGRVSELNLDKAQVIYDSDGIIKVNEVFQTSVPNIYAVGDVAQRRGLASTAVEQGRLAACHAFNLQDPFPDVYTDLPSSYGIYSIPEIAMVGKTEAELTEAKIPYETGVARFWDLEKGKLIGDTNGMLKILINSETLEVLGVHILGEGATEIIHVGQTVMAQKGTLGLLVHMVFNYPSLCQGYKIAALNAYNKVVGKRNIKVQE